MSEFMCKAAEPDSKPAQQQPVLAASARKTPISIAMAVLVWNLGGDPHMQLRRIGPSSLQLLVGAKVATKINLLPGVVELTPFICILAYDAL